MNPKTGSKEADLTSKISDDVVLAAAMLDQLLHRGALLTIEGESYRMRAHRERVEQVRKWLGV